MGQCPVMVTIWLLATAAVCCLLSCHAREDVKSAEQHKRHPILFVPGLGGSQLVARLKGKQHSSKIPVFCQTSSPEYVLWFNLLNMSPKLVDCTIDNLRLHYDPSTRTTSNTPGVEITVPYFGHTRGVEWIDPVFDQINKAAKSQSFISRIKDFFSEVGLLGDETQKTDWLMSPGRGTRGRLDMDVTKLVDDVLRLTSIKDLALFSDMANYLVLKGYERNKDLRAAPYDFRKAPNELGEFYSATQRLIEDTYASSGNRPVVVVGHSMGNLVMLHFYNRHVSPEWKDKYIRAHVAVAAPWAGSVKSLKLMVSGDALGIRWLKTTKLRQVQRSMPSTAFLLPQLGQWDSDEPLVTTPQRNYTASDYPALFRDMGYDTGYEMWEDVKDLNKGLEFPDVDMHCLYGVDVKTMGRLVFTGDTFPDKKPQVEMDDGDGTVNRRSLEAFMPWLSLNTTRVIRTMALHGLNHIDILKDTSVLTYVLRLATGG